MSALTVQPTTNAEIYRASTDAAKLCKDIVVATAMEIQKRKYVRVEGWQSIAIAHGCTGSARDVERVDGGVRAIGQVRRMSDGVVIAEAEGFVGEDEATWYGGEVESDVWEGPAGNRRKTGRKEVRVLPKRADYAIRAMAQTRAISRACRSAFAHVVVMMDAGLSTTPAEEVPAGGFDDPDVIQGAGRLRQQRQREPEDVQDSDPTSPKDHALFKGATSTIDIAKTQVELDDWETKNAGIMARMKDDLPEVHDAILVHLRNHRSALKSISETFGDTDEAAEKLGGGK